MIVLDASALLALLFRETGHEQVARTAGDSCMSTVNLSEVIGRFVRDGTEAAEALQWISALPIEIVPFGTIDAALAASLLPVTRQLGLSLGDRACLALALSRQSGAMTADRTWLRLELPIEIVSIR